MSLSKEYERMEYIEDAGTQYIDTGVRPEMAQNDGPWIYRGMGWWENLNAPALRAELAEVAE